MKNTVVYSAAILFVAAGALAATDAPIKAEAGIIKIEVDAKDLARCQETLARVAQMPSVTDDGTPMIFGKTGDLPQVACVVKGA